MAFAHDTDIALRTAAALVNTAVGIRADDAQDTLSSVEALRDFYETWGWTGRFDGDAAELEQARALRGRLRAVWQAADDDVAAAELVNELLRDGRALPQLVDHDGYGWHIHATDTDAPFARRMQVEAAMAFVDVIRAGELSRLRVCAADDCDDVLADLSRNRSKRYCEGGCGNRLAAAAYRSRQGG
ncbi:RNA-binding protein [Janibacter sp. Soil728]|uniref:CGNR zinc finger domain-containing protein n=1 Tax=Janibacter sp. Soil728 TaxID=1736393 RepID=UPI0006FE6214|nr:CGNR zinc finger domain-containing protein [Janibacter sp. Soil728]KRE37496.1 RNA-binding protein [Janibacter sp. Soil728]